MLAGKKTNTSSSHKGHTEKPKRLITFLGASLVLLTFLVKDYYRDRAKDASNAADSTLTKFELQRQIHDSYVRLAYVQEANDERLQAIQSLLQQHFMPANAASTGLNHIVVPAVNQYLLASDYAKLVTRSLSYVEPQFADSLNDFVDESDKGFSRTTNPNNKEDPAAVKEGIDALRGHLERKTSAFTDEMYKLLSERKENAEKHYQICSKWSVVAYFVGWAAALVGQLLGVKGLSSE